MSEAVVDGIVTRYEITGSGPPLLMFSPGGFNARLENWASLGIYRRLNLIEHLSRDFTCITFDRRESGRSGGRVQRVTWADYAAQGVGLLDHLAIDKAHLMGGCVGCSAVTALAVARPDRASSMVLYSPAGGPHYRMMSQARMWRHLAYVEEHGLQGVAALIDSHEEGFSKDPRVGPWVSVIRRDPEFAAAYVEQDRSCYTAVVTGMSRTLFDRDTVPGPEAEDLMHTDVPALIVPGQDTSHSTSAARYLEECLPNVEYWDVPAMEQSEANAPARLLRFLTNV